MQQAEEKRYALDEVRPLIDWLYFDHAWQMGQAKDLAGDGKATYDQLRSDAEKMLDDWHGRYFTHSLFLLMEAGSDVDDIVLCEEDRQVRLPMLRQQQTALPGVPSLCLADYLPPVSGKQKGIIGLFAVTVDGEMEEPVPGDPYQTMLRQTLADRLAEATAEKLHKEKMEGGIRPAVGYPSMPDMSMNFVLDELLGFRRIGIRLTENGMMIPHGSVSGLILTHPQARYFHLGKIDEVQLADYAARRNLPLETVRKYLRAVLKQ